jgi:peptidase M23-like protein
MKHLVILLPVLLAFQVGVQPALAWTWPVDGPVVRPFKLGDDPYAGGQHRGVDIGAPLGTPVRAPATGTIGFAGIVPTSGRSVTIQTADGYSVTLVQLGAIKAARGTNVAEGAVVGTVGPSEEPGVGGPHVHLGVRHTSDPNGYLDPLRFLPPRPADDPGPAPAPAAAPGQEPAPGAAADAAGPSTASPESATPPKAVSGQQSVPGQAALVKVSAARHVRANETRGVSAHGGIGQPGWGATVARPQAKSFPLTGRTDRRSFERLPAGDAPTAAVVSPGRGSRWPWALLPALLAAAAALGVLRRQLRDAGATDGAAAILLERVVASAEHADALRLREENRLVLDGDLERILLADPEALPDLDRNDDATEFVDVADDSRCRHSSRRTRRRSHRLSRAHGLRPWCPSPRAHV